MSSEDLGPISGMIGDWDVEAVITLPTGERVDATGTWTAREISMGKGIHSVMKLQAGGRPIEENDLWGYDPGENKLHLFSVTSDGNVHDHGGSLGEDKVVRLRWDGTVDGGPAHEEIAIDRRSPDEVKVFSVDYLGDTERSRIALTIKRKK